MKGDTEENVRFHTELPLRVRAQSDHHASVTASLTE
jgi:hypothetical protein